MITLRMKRTVKLTLLTLLMLLVSHVQTAAADQPIREPLSPSAFTISGACSFDVGLEDLVNREIVTTFFDKDGNATMQIVTGTLKSRLTNLSTGESLDVNISGPGRTVINPDGSATLTGTGRWLWILLPDFTPPGVQTGLFLISGQQKAVFDAAGNLTEFTVVGGQVIDLCAELSG